MGKKIIVESFQRLPRNKIIKKIGKYTFISSLGFFLCWLIVVAKWCNKLKIELLNIWMRENVG